MAETEDKVLKDIEKLKAKSKELICVHCKIEIPSKIWAVEAKGHYLCKICSSAALIEQTKKAIQEKEQIIEKLSDALRKIENDLKKGKKIILPTGFNKR